MRRLVTLALLLFFAVPFGISIAGCSRAPAVDFCNGQNSGVVVGQTTTLDLGPRLTGISLNQGEIGSIGSPTPRDCKGNSASAAGVIYSSTDMTLVDVVPTFGRLCAGTWNRNTGGGIADFTTCTPATRSGIAYITASAQGVTSNPIPIYVHPIVTSVILGPGSTNCATDPATNCAFDATQANGCGTIIPVTAYNGNACLSQGQSAQLVARAFTGTNINNPANNISCLVGPLQFGALNSSVVSVNATGLATAAQPGSSTISANTSNSSSSAGFFSTCPPKTIVLTTQGLTTPPTGPISVNQNTNQPFVTSVTDTNGVVLNNIQLEFLSTSPTTIPAFGSSTAPTFPGAATITAVCQPPLCNTSPFNAIGLFGNGTPVTSNGVQVNAIGTNLANVLFVASTQSQYLLPIDFTVPTQNSQLRLPYVPNSMVISEDSSAIYLGSTTELMVVSTAGGSATVSREDNSVPGRVLAVSPNNGTVVITDPNRKLIYLYNAGGGISSEYGGVGTRATFSPDSSTIYITTDDSRLLVYSTFTGWTSVPLVNQATDVAVTVPTTGVYLASTPITARTNCPISTVTGTFPSQQTTNTFYPQADLNPASAQRLAATNDGNHIIAASPTALSDLLLAPRANFCPAATPAGSPAQTFTSTLAAARPFTGVTPTAITNVLPTSDSAFSFVTFQGTGGALPQYIQGTSTLVNLPLQKTAAGAPIAPVNGVISADNQTFFVGTTGDNLVHRLTRGTAGFTDTLAPITPALPLFSGTGFATPDLLVQRPRKATN